MTPCPYGFRIVGRVAEPRRLVDAAAALAGYCACDSKAEVEREAYLSAFQFGDEMRRCIDAKGNGSTAGYAGPCWSPWLWFDIDRPDLDAALKDARRLALSLDERYLPADDALLVFFSGGKGFHFGVPTGVWSPEPSPTFHRACRRFAEAAADAAGVTIDSGVYDAVRAFRAPNSRHPKTGLHKRRLSLDELLGLSLGRIVELARTPTPFDMPEPRGASEQAAVDWQTAVEQVNRHGEVKAARRSARNGSPTLNRSTLDFIRDGAGTGDRHRLLFSAAANLQEFDCSPALAVALLEGSALDAGLPPKDVRRQIYCGLAAGSKHPADPQAEAATPDKPPGPPPSATSSESPDGSALAAKLRALWSGKPNGSTSAAAPAIPLPPSPEPPAEESLTRCRSHIDRADWLDESGADDRLGWIRTSCRRCGAFIGHRPSAEQRAAQ